MSASRLRILGLMITSSWLFVGCNSAKKIEVGGTCVLNSDCNSPLVCSAGKCHDACHTSADCPAGQSCIIASDQSTVCQGPTPCVYNSDCLPPFTCGADQRCRNQCQKDVDCTPGQTCTTTGTCAEPGEVDSNNNLVGPDGGIAGCPVGTETCSCYPNDTCNAGLTCASHLCVSLGAGGSGGGGGGVPDAPGVQPDGPIGGTSGGVTGVGGTRGSGGAPGSSGGALVTSSGGTARLDGGVVGSDGASGGNDTTGPSTGDCPPGQTWNPNAQPPACGCSAAAANSSIDWTNLDRARNTATGTLGNVGVTLTGGVLDYSILDGTFTGFADATLFIPPLPASDVVEFRGAPSSYSYTVSFSDVTSGKPVTLTDPVLYLYSLAATLTFTLPTNVSLERVSGDTDFKVTGSVVAGALCGGCSPSDSNGTVRLKGTLSSFSFSAYWGQPEGDGIYLQMSVQCQ